MKTLEENGQKYSFSTTYLIIALIFTLHPSILNAENHLPNSKYLDEIFEEVKNLCRNIAIEKSQHIEKKIKELNDCKKETKDLLSKFKNKNKELEKSAKNINDQLKKVEARNQEITEYKNELIIAIEKNRCKLTGICSITLSLSSPAIESTEEVDSINSEITNSNNQIINFEEKVKEIFKEIKCDERINNKSEAVIKEIEKKIQKCTNIKKETTIKIETHKKNGDDLIKEISLKILKIKNKNSEIIDQIVPLARKNDELESKINKIPPPLPPIERPCSYRLAPGETHCYPIRP